MALLQNCKVGGYVMILPMGHKLHTEIFSTTITIDSADFKAWLQGCMHQNLNLMQSPFLFYTLFKSSAFLSFGIGVGEVFVGEWNSLPGIMVPCYGRQYKL